MLPIEATKLVTGETIKTISKLSRHLGLMDDDISVQGKKLCLKGMNRVEEFSPNMIFDSETSILYLHESTMEAYVSAFVEGFNVYVMIIGGAHSEKGKLLEGGKQQEGLVELFSEEVIRRLESKKISFNERGKQHSFSLKFGACEIADESVTDLLGGPGCRVEVGDWEGPKISGSTEYSVSNFSKFREAFNNAKVRRTKYVSEFGPLAFKSSAFYWLELLQVIDGVVLVSKLGFIEMPAVDCLSEDRETVIQREGASLNKGLFSFVEVIKALGSNQPAHHESSQITTLLKEALGGNSYTLVFGCVSQGDTQATRATMQTLSLLSRVTNFPILNEGNLLGLLRAYRLELRRARDYSVKRPPEDDLRLIELEKRVVEDNLGKIKTIDSNERLARQLGAIHEQYSRLKRQNDAIKADLIRSEEEKLQMSEAVIQLQIENTRLESDLQNTTHDANYKVVGHEAELINLQAREQKALEVISNLTNELDKCQEEKNELETELVVIRKNYSNLNGKNDEITSQFQEMQIEIINIVNEKKELEKELNRVTSTLKSNEFKINDGSFKTKELQKEYDRMREALLDMKAQNEDLRAKLVREELKRQEYTLELENKQLEMQKGFFDMNRKKQHELEYMALEETQKNSEKESDRIVKESERRELMAKTRNLSRTLEESHRRMAELQKLLDESRDKGAVLERQNEEMRTNYRNKLLSYVQNEANNYLNAREDLLRNYAEREMELLGKLELANSKTQALKQELNALKRYASDLKYLAEDWAPLGQPLPEILLQPMPVKQMNDTNEKRLDKLNEEQKLRERNQRLEHELLTIQRKLAQVEKTDSLMGNTDPYNTTVKTLAEENAKLKDQISKLTLMAHEHNNAGVLHLEQENEKLRYKIKVFEEKTGVSTSSSGDMRQLQNKMVYFERMIQSMEIERSQLLSRATLAEEQLKALQGQHDRMLKASKMKLAELKSKM